MESNPKNQKMKCMNDSSKEYVEHLRRKYPPGTRLQLSCMEDEMAVPPGSMGTVECIDDMGQIHVDWDCGRSLVLIPGVVSCLSQILFPETLSYIN